MKIRTGFVSNSSSSCFICHNDCREDEQFCESCLPEVVLAPDFIRWLGKKYGIPVDEEFIAKTLRDYNAARGSGWET